jgi:hypothetical protein
MSNIRIPAMIVAIPVILIAGTFFRSDDSCSDRIIADLG